MVNLLDIRGIGEKTKERLGLLGITDIKKLLEFMPVSYIDMSKFSDIADMSEGNYYRFRAKIIRINKIMKGRRANYFSVQALISNTKIKMIWYNQPYLYNKLKLDQEYTFFGKIMCKMGKLEMLNALFEEKDKEKKLKGILSIYRTQGLVNQANLRKFIAEAIQLVNFESVSDGISGIMGYQESLELAHFPNCISNGYSAQERLVIEDLINTILTFRLLKKLNEHNKGRSYKSLDYNRVLQILPYQLSITQIKAISEIINDMSKPTPMNRLLLGDVGSGKTVVAMIASYIAAINGYQVAIMAPTTILARQHYDNFLILSKLGLNISLITSDTKSQDRDNILKGLKNGEIDIVIGTQSLISEGMIFKSLALVISDEMHRFGVREKSEINSKGYLTDTLVMSATPIPRALALTLYEDLDISTIDRYRDINIDTHIVPNDKMEDMLNFIAKELDKGRQAYIVCPRIEDVEGIELVSAKAIYDDLRRGLLAKYSMALMHGKLADDKKMKIMQDFKHGKVQLLVSTTVIEVGIDNPNATIMVIMNAECFGLATLHQLRGRIGRGTHKSFCLLITDKASDRLKALKQYSNGNDIADIDYELRGGGDFIGLRQKGRVGNSNYIVDVNKGMIIKAKEIAEKIDVNKVKKLLITDNEKIEELSQVVMN